MAYGLTQSLDLEDSSSQYASAADSVSLSIVASFTVECWAKFESLASAGNANTMMAKWVDSGSRSWLFNWDNGVSTAGTSLHMRVSTDSTNPGSSSFDCTFNPNLGQWYHLAGAYTSGLPGTAILCIDGVSQTINSGTGATTVNDSNVATAIGSLNVGGTANWMFDGKISLARVWNGSARSQAQIAANMCNVLGATALLAAEWTLDNTDNDNSGNSNTLTRAGGAGFSADVPSLCAVVGPANLKSLDGNVKSNIKSFDGNLLANMKSIDGNA